MTSRLREFVLPYLSLQEGLDLEICPPNGRRASRLMAELLTSMGKKPWISLGRRSWCLAVDPLPHLRTIYLIVLRSKRRGGGYLRLDKLHLFCQSWLFRIKSTTLRKLAVALSWLASRGASEDRFRKIFRSRIFQRNFRFTLLLLFAEAHRLNAQQWKLLTEKIEDHFIPLIWRLFQVIDGDSVKHHGIIKMLKIAFGVVVWRQAAQPENLGNEASFIFDTLRLGYSWGTTYPLIDNMLDSSQTGSDFRVELATSLRELFASTKTTCQNVTSLHSPTVLEARARLVEVLDLVPLGLRAQAKAILGHLLEAHFRDSGRRLSEMAGPWLPDDEAAIWEDSVLKAALIRIATIIVCGMPVSVQTLVKQLMASLVNQLGDDLWDIYEDYHDDRLTPFTAYLNGLTQRNPFRFFVDYCMMLAEYLPGKQQIALLIGMQETLRCLVEDLAKRGSDPLGALHHVNKLLKDLNVGLSLVDLCYVPHVDPDAVLFGLETGLFGD